MIQIKPSEFYEKYWKIDSGNGVMVSPKPLTDSEKDFLDGWMGSCVNICKMQLRRKSTNEVIEIDVEELEKQMKQLPDFLKQK